MLLGIDTGGTFTDLVADDGTVVKVPSTPDDPARAVRAAIAEADTGSSRPALLAHGTTVATNALLERNLGRVALVTNTGFADLIEIARQARPALYDLHADRPPPLVPREWRYEVAGRRDARGREVVAFDGVLPNLDGAVECVAVCLLHSDLDAAHERAVVGALIARGIDAIGSAEVSPEFREYERMVTTIADAALRPVCRSYLGALHDELVGTDLELTIRVNVPAETEGEGSAVIPARLFAEILQKLEGGRVDVEFEEADARIQGGRFAMTLRTLSAAEFPRLPEVAAEGVRVDAAAFAEALRQVVPGASKDDARPILTGVLLTASPDGLRLVATDSYRLALRDLQGVSMLAEGQKVLVAAKGLGEVQRLLTSVGTGEIDVVLGEREVVFRVGTTEVTTRLIEGEFPNYQQLIPSGYPNRLTVGRDALQAAVNRVRLVGGGKDQAPIRLGMSAEGLELSANAQDVGEAHEAVEAKYEGTELTVAFNSQFLLDGIDAAATDEVVIESIDPLKPAVMKAMDSGDFLYLLMPVRIA